MAKRRNRPKIGDALSNRTAKTFIGREEQLALFRQNFNENLPDEDFKWIFNIHGQGGIGKTTLSKQYQRIAEKEEIKVAFLDLEDSRLKNVPNLLGEIVRQLTKQKIDFSEFDKKYNNFKETLKELSKDEEATPGLLNAIVSGGIKTGVSELKKIPGSGILDHLNTDGLADKIGNYSTFLFKKFKDKNKRELMTEPNTILATAFLKDIREQDEDICLIFDTYETAFFSLDGWLRDIYDEKFGELPDNLFLVISGRDELSEKWQKLATITHKILLEQFTATEAIDFLKSKGITKDAIIKTLVEISDRFPVLLNLLADNPPTSPDEINDVSGNAIERFLKWIKNPEERAIILAAALPRAINQDMVAELLTVLGIDNNKCEQYYDLLNKQPFVQQRGNIKTYHPVVKGQMLKYQYQTSPDNWHKKHIALAKYFDRRANNLGLDTSETQYNNKKWIQLTLEATYHKLCANFDKELPFAVERMAIHLDRTRTVESMINWGQIIFESGQLVGENDLVTFIQKGIAGWISRDDRVISEFLEKIIEHEWIYEVKSNFLIYAQFISSSTDEYKVLEIFNKALLLNYQNSELYVHLGRFYKRNGFLSKAIYNFNLAIEIKSNVFYANSLLGFIYFQNGNVDKSLSSLQKELLINPNGDYIHHIHTCIGIIYQKKKNLDKAIINYEEAIKINPTYAHAYELLGSIHAEKRNIDESIKYYKKSIKLNPNSKTYFNLGNIYKVLNQFNEAIENYENAIELNPTYIKAFSNLADTYHKKNELDQAILTYNRVIELNPTEAMFYIDLGNIYFDKNKLNQAIENYKKATKLVPLDIDYLMILAVTYFLNHEIENSLKTFQDAILIDSDNIDAHTNIGFIYIREEEYEKANEYIQKAWKLSEQKGYYAAKNIAHLSLLKEDRKTAIEKYKTAIPLWKNFEAYLGELESDYIHLKIEEKGITKTAYQEILDILKKEVA